jgi:hypothetical protein
MSDKFGPSADTMPAPSKPEHRPGRRLITQNLLSSATHFERSNIVGWQTIADLSTLIDLFCLYDRALVLSREHDKLPEFNNSKLVAMLTRDHFLSLWRPENNAKITRTAATHLATFLGGVDQEPYIGLLREAMQGDLHEYRQLVDPDHPSDVNNGRQWLLTQPSEGELLEQLEKERTASDSHAYLATLYVLRTFVYLASATEEGVAFAPDVVRAAALETVLDKEEQFRGRLLEQLRKVWGKSLPFGEPELQTSVTPFAAVVFTRAGSSTERIAEEMLGLRTSLQPLRDRLRQLEDRRLWGSRDQALAAQAEWNAALEEVNRSLSQAPMGLAPIETKVRHGLNYTKAFLGVASESYNPVEWLQGLIASPLPDDLLRILSERSVVEIHRLRRELPGWGTLQANVESLFGPLSE